MREAARLERLVGDLLDLARMNRSEFSIRREPVDLGAVVREAVQRYEQQARAFGVELEAVVDESPAVLGDADRLLQVASNLVENALRLTPPGGRVRVLAKPGVLAVEDTGPGLQPEDLAARVRALLPPRPLRPGAPGRHRPRARDRAGAREGDGRHRLGHERPGPRDALRAAAPVGTDAGPAAARLNGLRPLYLRRTEG